MLACKGFVTLALAYCNYDDLPKTAKHLDLEYFEEATEFLVSQPNVIPDRCAVIGTSRASIFPIAMSIHLDKVKAAVIIGGTMTSFDITLTYKGKEIQKVSCQPQEFTDINAEGMIVNKESKLREIYSHDHPHFPQCEQVPEDTHFLLACGDQDAMYANISHESFVERMNIHKREAQCHALLYPGLGHVLETPYCALAKYSVYKIPIPSADGTINTMNLIFTFGGEAKPTCDAEEDFWPKLQDFIRHHVRNLSQWFQDSLELKE